MREIITLEVGGAGNNIGRCFWQLISYEHGLNYYTGELEDCVCGLQLERMNVYFNATEKGRFYAREISIDTDPDAAYHDCAFIYNRDNIVRGCCCSGNNFASGYFTQGAAILEKTIEAIRREAECHEALQGYQILHSVGGGTGSGFCSLLMNCLVDEYPDNLLSNYVIFPSPHLSEVIVEPYNTILTIPTLRALSHLTFCLDNEALYQITLRNLKQNGGLDNINHIIALTMSGVTSCLRFPGQLNSGLRKIFVNMIPFPSLHFLVTSFAPLQNCKTRAYMRGSACELIQAMFSSNNLLCYIDLTTGKLLTAAGIFRGKMSTRDVEQIVSLIREKNNELFVEWIPNNIKLAFCDIPPRGFAVSGTFLGNSSAIADVLQRIYDQAATMLCRKAHLHWYFGEGLEQQELDEAMETTTDIIQEYKCCSGCSDCASPED